MSTAYRENRTDLIRRAAAGRWGFVLGRLAAPLDQALAKPGHHVPCPVHGGKDGFRVYKEVDQAGRSVCNTCGHFSDGFATLMWVNNWSFPETLDAIEDVLGLDSKGQVRSRYVPPPQVERASNPEETAKRVHTLTELYLQTVSLSNPVAKPARLYLESRGLQWMIVPNSVRFHPRMGYFSEGKLLGNYPAIVVKYQNGEKGVTFHRTFLTPEGNKAPVPEVKKAMPVPNDRKMAGSAMWIDAPAKTMLIAEGLETTLTCRQATQLPAIAAGSTTFLSTVELPSVIRQLVIFADKDHSKAGEHAAKALSERAWKQGIVCCTYFPPGELTDSVKTLDWNDHWIAHGKVGFPDLRRLLKP
ncbi:MAG: zinc-binding protein [Rhizobium sp.]|nr:MAG: zinc-binding protein [Rhizobium sp.]